MGEVDGFVGEHDGDAVAHEAVEHLATFVLDREEYGVDVKQVQEIRRVGEITAVPRAPEFVRGVINLRGRILPVLDLKRKLNLGEVGVDRAARITPLIDVVFLLLVFFLLRFIKPIATPATAAPAAA